MNLDFGILWIEDQYTVQEEESLKRRIANAGFVARIDTLPNGQGLEERAREHRLYHRYDFILLDYRLQDESGNELAPRVRGLFPSTTILFYSGSADERALRTMIADKEVEGVYCASRARFIDRTGTLIDQTARALDRLSGMRGLAMRVVAECDTLMRSAVVSMSGRSELCASKLSDLDVDVTKHLDETRDKYAIAMQGNLQARLDSFAVDSKKLHSHFRRLTQAAAQDPSAFGMDGDKVDRLRELRGSSSQYENKVLHMRNKLGHAAEVQGPNGWALDGKSGLSVTQFPQIRRDFAEHIDAFREMCGLIDNADAGQSN